MAKPDEDEKPATKPTPAAKPKPEPAPKEFTLQEAPKGAKLTPLQAVLLGRDPTEDDTPGRLYAQALYVTKEGNVVAGPAKIYAHERADLGHAFRDVHEGNRTMGVALQYADSQLGIEH